MLVSSEPLKALSPIFFTESGINVFLQPYKSVSDSEQMRALQLSRESKNLFSGETVILAKLEQSSKASNPI